MRSKLIVIWLLGIWAIGIGLKFIISTLDNNIHFYDVSPSNTLDLFFDWGMLFILGLTSLIISIKEWSVKKCKGKQKESC